MKLALGIVAAASITAALGEGPGTTPGQDRTAEAPARHEAVAPEDALHESIRSKFVQDRFLEPSEAAGYPPKAMMGFTSSDRCPDGWEQVRAEDGAPLFHAFGLLVDAGGTRRSGYIRVPACMKRQLRGAPDAGAHRRWPAARLRLPVPRPALGPPRPRRLRTRATRRTGARSRPKAPSSAAAPRRTRRSAPAAAGRQRPAPRRPSPRTPSSRPSAGPSSAPTTAPPGPGRCGTPGPAGPARGAPPSAPRSSGTATRPPPASAA